MVPIPKKEVILKLRELRQPVTLYGENERDRYNRFVLCEGKYGYDVKKDTQDTSRSILPKQSEIEHHREARN